MNNCETQVFGSHNDRALASASIHAAARELPEEPLPAQTLTESLNALAGKVNHALLWLIEIIALLGVLSFALLMLNAAGWKPIGALIATGAYSTLAACTGGYLLLIRRRSEARR